MKTPKLDSVVTLLINDWLRYIVHIM